MRLPIDERVRLVKLLNGHIATFDQNLKAIEADVDKYKAEYLDLEQRIKADMNSDDWQRKSIADLAFVGWQAMQIEFLRRTLEGS